MSTDIQTADAFLEKIVTLANETRKRLDGSFAQVRAIVDEAEFVIAIWQDKTEPSGVGRMLIKGDQDLEGIVASGEAAPRLLAAIPCVSAEQAEALRQIIVEEASSIDPLIAEKYLDGIRGSIVLDLELQRDWRLKKQEEYPDDKRNGEAAKCFSKIKTTVTDIPPELLLRLQAAFATENLCVAEKWVDTLRRVGFYSEPASAQALVEGFLAEIEPQIAERAA